jgi:hypothetical protein
LFATEARRHRDLYLIFVTGFCASVFAQAVIRIRKKNCQESHDFPCHGHSNSYQKLFFEIQKPLYSVKVVKLPPFRLNLHIDFCVLERKFLKKYLHIKCNI